MMHEAASSGLHFRGDVHLWWPDYDPKQDKNYARVMKHITDMDVAIRIAKKRRVCVQAGAHVGLWPMRLAHFFRKVHTFEPEKTLLRALLLNLQMRDEDNAHDFTYAERIDVHGKALGKEVGDGKLRFHSSPGSARLDVQGDRDVCVTTIDALGLEVCDVIFLDIEGGEIDALKGASETLRYHRPIVHVEELEPYKNKLRAFMQAIGYVRYADAGPDGVYIPPKEKVRR